MKFKWKRPQDNDASRSAGKFLKGILRQLDHHRKAVCQRTEMNMTSQNANRTQLVWAVNRRRNGRS